MLSKKIKAVMAALTACVMLSSCGTYQTQVDMNNAAGTNQQALYSEEPQESEAPVVESSSEPTQEASNAPEATKKTEKPKATKKPGSSKDEKETEKPEATKKPTATKKPEATKKPAATKKPSATKKPAATKKPEATQPPKQEEPETITLYINEIMSSNGTIPDADGNNEDWIEIYNPGKQAVNLKGYFLSDDSLDPFRWTFPDVSVPAKGHLIVWISGKDKVDANGLPHTSFRLKASGEDIILTASDKKTVMDTFASTTIARDKSYGRETDGSKNWKVFDKPTPGKAN